MSNLLPNEPGPFREWLEGQEPDAVVGTARTSLDCPLTRYLRANGFPKAAVYMDTYCVNIDAPLHGLPEWAKDVRHRIDDRTNGTPVTAAEALAVLREVCDAS